MLKKLFNFIRNLFVEEKPDCYVTPEQQRKMTKENYVNRYYYIFMNCPRM